MFTLLELRALLSAAGLEPVTVFFASLENDRVARAAYRAARPLDVEQADLAAWHELELRQPELFGRMHLLYCRRVEGEGESGDG